MTTRCSFCSSDSCSPAAPACRSMRGLVVGEAMRQSRATLEGAVVSFCAASCGPLAGDREYMAHMRVVVDTALGLVEKAGRAELSYAAERKEVARGR